MRTDIAYGITSLPPSVADASHLLALVRGHWRIENGLFHRRGCPLGRITFGEDRSLLRRGNGPQVQTTLNDLRVGLLLREGHTNAAAGRRLYAAFPDLEGTYAAAHARGTDAADHFVRLLDAPGVKRAVPRLRIILDALADDDWMMFLRKWRFLNGAVVTISSPRAFFITIDPRNICSQAGLLAWAKEKSKDVDRRWWVTGTYRAVRQRVVGATARSPEHGAVAAD